MYQKQVHALQGKFRLIKHPKTFKKGEMSAVVKTVSIKRGPVNKTLSHLKLPVVFVYGLNDPNLDLEGIREELKNQPLLKEVPIKDASHIIAIDQPDELTKVIEESFWPN